MDIIIDRITDYITANNFSDDETTEFLADLIRWCEESIRAVNTTK